MKVKFKTIKVGDIFSIVSNLPDENEYLNIKVSSSLLVDGNRNIPYNVINLRTGSPRTFDDNEMVFRYDGYKLIGKK